MTLIEDKIKSYKLALTCKGWTKQEKLLVERFIEHLEEIKTRNKK